MITSIQNHPCALINKELNFTSNTMDDYDIHLVLKGRICHFTEWEIQPYNPEMSMSYYEYQHLLQCVCWLMPSVTAGRYRTCDVSSLGGPVHQDETRCNLNHWNTQLGTSNKGFCFVLYKLLGGGPRVVVSTAAFHARARSLVPGLGGLKETKCFFPIHV